MIHRQDPHYVSRIPENMKNHHVEFVTRGTPLRDVSFTLRGVVKTKYKCAWFIKPTAWSWQQRYQFCRCIAHFEKITSCDSMDIFWRFLYDVTKSCLYDWRPPMQATAKQHDWLWGLWLLLIVSLEC